MMMMMLMVMMMMMMMMIGNLDMLHSPFAIINSDKSGSLCVVDIVLEFRIDLVLRRRHLCRPRLRPFQPHPQPPHIAHIALISHFSHQIALSQIGHTHLLVVRPRKEEGQDHQRCSTLNKRTRFFLLFPAGKSEMSLN